MNYDELWDNKKILGWKSTPLLDKIKLLISIGSYPLTCRYWLVWLDDSTCLTIIHKNETPWEDLVSKGSNFADFVRFRPHTYTRTQQSLPPLWVAISISYRTVPSTMWTISSEFLIFCWLNNSNEKWGKYWPYCAR